MKEQIMSHINKKETQMRSQWISTCPSIDELIMRPDNSVSLECLSFMLTTLIIQFNLT